MLQGKLNKARRGELRFALPVGYQWHRGEVRLEPDEQARSVIKLIFRKFEELGTLHAVLRYLVSHDIQLGIRPSSSANKGELVWRRANRMSLQNVPTNPTYAGVYAYGRRRTDARKKKPGRPATGNTIITWLNTVALGKAQDERSYHRLSGPLKYQSACYLLT